MAGEWAEVALSELTDPETPITYGVVKPGLLFRDSAHAKDRTFNLIAWMIVISFACYIPVILFAPTHELVGMLMIPKTCAYLAVEFIAYNALFRADRSL